MATAFLADGVAPEDLGRLTNNYTYVLCLQSSLSRSDTNLKAVPEALEAIIEDNAWRAFRLPDGRIVRNSADFRRFIEAPRPEGCQTQLHVLRQMVAGSAVEGEVERLLRGTPGATKGEVRNPYGVDGKPQEEINRNNGTVNLPGDEPTIIPIPDPRVRDYARESKQGNSVGYTLRRLEKHAPDFLDRVKRGELSPHRAAIEAGLKDDIFSVPAVPRKAARVLVRHFRGEDLAELIDLLADALAGERGD